MPHISTKQEKMSPSTVLTMTSPTQSPMKNDNKEDNKFHRVQLVTEEQPNGGTCDASWDHDAC